MNDTERVLQFVEGNGGFKARDIGARLGIDRSEVNSILYAAQQRGDVVQDNRYRWWPKDNRKEAAMERTEQRPHSMLARLARYYLECLSQDLDNDVSVFATSRYDLDYAELASLPQFDEKEGNIFSSDEAQRLLNQVRRDRQGKVLYLGYPVRLRHHRSQRSKWEGFFVEPVCLFPFQDDLDGQSGQPVLNDDMPLFNYGVLKSLMFVNSGNVLDEAIQLAEELGLANIDKELPDLDEVFHRLRAVRPEWDWSEDPDPHALTTSPPLSDVQQQGIYNRAVLIVGERSPFTKGLEVELGKLAKLDSGDYKETALGDWIREDTIEAPVPDNQPLLEVLPLNAEQRQAVVQSLTNPLTVVTGPPGTGKSQVVTSLLVNAAWQGKRVLFASKNNKAVDVVEERVNALGPRPILLRMGHNEYQTRLADYLTSILAATATADDKSNYQFHLDIHERLRDRFDKLDQELNEVIALRNEVDRLERATEEIRRTLEKKRFQKCRTVEINSLLEASQSFLAAIDRAIREEQSLWIRLFWFAAKGKRYERLLQESSKLRRFEEVLGVSLPQQEPDDATIDEWILFAADLRERVQFVDQAHTYFNMLERLNQHKAPERIAQEYARLTQEMADNSRRLWEYWLRLQPSRMGKDERRLLSEYTSLLQMIVASNENNTRAGRGVFQQYQNLYPEIAKILTCWAITSLSARRIPFESGFFDLVVIDEASQCDIASALPLLYRARRAVIIGDPQQLKHISSITERQDRQLLSKHELAAGYAMWAYSVNSLFDLARSVCRGEDIVTLRDHHRSHADIINFSNTHFYEGRLRVATNYKSLRRPKRDHPAVRWSDVQGQVVRPSAGGALNKAEVEAVVREVERLLLGQGYRGTVGVVTPFRAQAQRIRDLIHQQDALTPYLALADLLVDTVHKFQGDERDIMIFSPVVSSGITDGALRFLARNGNLFNVAITRARSALVVVGDRQAAAHSGVDYLAAFASYIERLGIDRNVRGEEAEEPGPDYPQVRRPELVSSWEKTLYRALYRAGLRPMPQYEVDQYILDFALFDGDRKLDIEVDGERYHRDWDGELCRRDQLRNQRLIEMGWDIMRFWVYQIRDDLDGCVRRAQRWIEAAKAG